MSDAMHAHKCQKCGAVWIHPDNSPPEAHKCPNCGAEELKKWLVPVGQLPRAVPQGTQIINVVDVTALFYMLMYSAFIVWGVVYIVKLIQIYWKKDGGNGVASV